MVGKEAGAAEEAAVTRGASIHEAGGWEPSHLASACKQDFEVQSQLAKVKKVGERSKIMQN